ncbi:MAG TPA: RNA-binding cell elongation regulator Jag/EloR [Acidimicrobiales bacterium]|nr:RNA-binding cell elongation regulator Jag/EloR [Acidimicrobiales bacterium]
MEWVETTGKTVDEATERALAHLGVTRDDAEVEVVEEPRSGLFGRLRGEYRVRARVRPVKPRPKRGRRPAEGGGRGRVPSDGGDQESRGSRDGQGRSRRSRGRSTASTRPDSPAGPALSDDRATPRPERRERAPRAPKAETFDKQKENTMAEGLSLAEQGALAREFLVGLLGVMGIDAQVSVREVDEETVELAVDADPATELGILVGPRGTTLQALQEVTRTVVQAKSEGRTDRILVDVARYRERRVAALGRFARQVADEVAETGEERALEPMSPADRKAVHDSLADDERVTTRSEGEEPRRFVVIAPA